MNNIKNMEYITNLMKLAGMESMAEKVGIEPVLGLLALAVGLLCIVFSWLLLSHWAVSLQAELRSRHVRRAQEVEGDGRPRADIDLRAYRIRRSETPFIQWHHNPTAIVFILDLNDFRLRNWRSIMVVRSQIFEVYDGYTGFRAQPVYSTVRATVRTADLAAYLYRGGRIFVNGEPAQLHHGADGRVSHVVIPVTE